MTTSQTKLTLQELIGSGWLASANTAYVETLFELYQKDPAKVDLQWQSFFKKVLNGEPLSHLLNEMPSVNRSVHSTYVGEESNKTGSSLHVIMNLIEAFRTYGHLQAKLDPLNLSNTPEIPQLNLETYGLTFDDTDSIALQGQLGLNAATPARILERLHSIYCGAIGFEYQHILSIEEKHWLINRIETIRPENTAETKKRILHRLLESEGFEKHLGTQFVAVKRFSIEGADTAMPMLDRLLIEAARQEVKSVVFGMAHRGRLNVLVNLLGKAPRVVFEEFTGQYDEGDVLSGDVKYHKGFSTQLKTPEGILEATLAFNPSHLEIVNPVVEGIARAQQDQIEANAEHSVLPILIHGDAAFAGQGIVMETLQLSQTSACKTGGTIHIVLNNQIGFTTDPHQSRSTRYCTDIAKMIEAPVFHVNGNDPEAACWAMQLALDFRMQFKKDVVIDLVCYRRYGHNEADEPAATQPLMYKEIRGQKPIWTYYAKQLQDQGVIQTGEAEAWLNDYRKRVAAGEPVAPFATKEVLSRLEQQSEEADWRESVKTGVALKTLKGFEKTLTQLPEGMVLQPQVGKLMADRQKMLQGQLALNWGTAETLAYATLLSEGFNVRLTGQDVERGTFAHRHAVLHDNQSGSTYRPLDAVTQKSKQFSIYDSILSEAATMGFEYGYAYTRDQSLVIWEAQYGDFVNGAQLVIDQFLSASEKKWGQLSGLVLLLPHGYEGSGPEHSSARLERFLQLCAQENLQVCVPTTPAQQFHLLRRQLLRKNWRKPLVIMSPKSLLRHKQATSDLNELSEGAFKPVLDVNTKTSAVDRVVLCSGKVYYDLMAEKEKYNTKTAIIRIEQLYPFPDVELKAALQAYTAAKEIVWCQEEPKNQGSWQWIMTRLQECLTAQQTLRYAGRPEAAATAVGSPLRHTAEQRELIQMALA
jgi:2-oxoglutarate dehydrogenase E1 component